MATWVGVGTSRRSDSYQAGQEAAAKALESMGPSDPDLVLVFSSVRFDQESLISGILSKTPRSPLVGCSTAGEILPEGPSRRSVAVMAIRSDTLKSATGIGLNMSENPRRAGEELARQVSQIRLPAPQGLFIFPDGLSGNGAEVVRGIQDVLGLSFPIAGGSAADDFGFTRTYQYVNGKVYTDAVSGVLLAGPIRLGIGARHGWQPLGRPRRVTRAMANVVQELDGHTAVNLYETYFGASASAETLADMSIVYPLGMPIPGEEEYLLRNVLRVDPDGSLVYTGEVPQGSEVRLMMGTKAKVLEASRRAAEGATLAIAPYAPRFGMVLSSCSRARLFGHRASQEIQAVRQALGETVPFIGFYTYGEQAPFSATAFHGRSHFHNESIVVAAVSTD